MSDVSVRDAARQVLADGLLAKHSAEADLELDAPTSIQDIRDRLLRCTRGCRCDDGDHENAVHDVASSDVPVLLAAFEDALSTLQKVREALPELLDAAWDDGNASGLDGWTGPGRGAGEVDEYAVEQRRRSTERLVARILDGGDQQ